MQSGGPWVPGRAGAEGGGGDHRLSVASALLGERREAGNDWGHARAYLNPSATFNPSSTKPYLVALKKAPSENEKARPQTNSQEDIVSARGDMG